ncbi:MAG: histidine kinase [Flavobacteriaceae bacterium]|nr:MAG: histidine kinase [Flavobacteriaceae bacterium]
MLQISIIIQERERKRIASDLHDHLIAQLHRTKLINLDSSINGMLKKSIAMARYISHDLSPPLLAKTSVTSLFEDFLNPFREKYVITIWFSPGNNKDINEIKKLQLFRIFQEVIVNCDKHAKATEIEVLLRISKKYVHLIIKDNGIGIKKTSVRGLGLKNIELRVAFLKGTYRIQQNKPKGTVFILSTHKIEVETLLPQTSLVRYFSMRFFSCRTSICKSCIAFRTSL